MALTKDWTYIGSRVEPAMADTFITKAGGKGQVSEVLRGLIKMFNEGKIIVTIEKTIGG